MNTIVYLGTILILLIIGVINVNGQPNNVKAPTFPSPNAASLGKYGDIPVSYHTGVPNISIPIYTVTQGSLSLPISLSYHSSGLKVDEVASNVGLGWSLNAGGMITRSVNGGPDEGVSGSIVDGISPLVGWGWYKNGGIPADVISCSPRPLSIEGPVPGTFPTWHGCRSIYFDAAKGYIDTEPDLFTFNVGGASGKFFFDTNQKIHMIPESDFVIQPINTPGYFYAWRIISPDGTKYYFGGTAKELSCSDPAGQSGSPQVSTSTTWYLYKIESANGEDWINLSYVDDYYSFGNRAGHSMNFRGLDYYGQGGGNAGQPMGDYVNASNILGTTVVTGKRLTQITTSSGQNTVDFIPATEGREDLTFYNGSTFYVETANTTSKRLKTIQISNGTFCKKFELNHDYFLSSECSGCTASWAYSNFDKKRLRLNWIQESTCSGTDALPKYEFTYNTTQLPRRYSLARDTWGYYNGQNSNTGLLETFSNPVPSVNMTYTTGNFRTVNETMTQAGILTQIKYPTTGSSQFVYEGHKDQAETAVGGLRIKNIINNDAYGNSTTKTFTYLYGNVFYSPDTYAYQFPNDNDMFTGAFLGGADFGIQHLSMPFPPMWSSQGYHIGYGQVKVEETGNGSITYNFRNNAPTVINPAYYPLKPVVAQAGTSEQTQEEFKNNAGTVLARSSSSSSMIGPVTTITARKVTLVNCVNCNLSEWAYDTFGLFMDYTIDAYRYNPISQGQFKDGVTTLTTLTYDASPVHNNPRSTEVTNSDNEVVRTEFNFVSDAGSGAPAAMYQSTDPNFKNMLGAVTEQRMYSNGTLTSKQTNQFVQRGSSILVSSTKKYPSGTSEFVEDQYQFNDNLDVNNITATNTGINKGFQWGYNNTVPTVEVTNAANTKYTVATNGNSNSFISVSGYNTVNTSNTFTVGYTGTVQLKVGTSNTAFTTYVDYSGALGSGTLTLTGGQSCGFNQVLFSNVAPGTYTINMTVRASSTGVTVSACGQVTYPDVILSTSGITEFFYENFEEGSATGAATPHTGKKYLLGDYTNTFLKPNTRAYVIEYWYLNGSIWTYATTTYTDGMILTNGSAIDNVRIYPADARMKSYTYDPAFGITSVIDENGSVQFYEYDNFGRLAQVKDSNGHIVQNYTYNYKTN